MVEKSLLIEKSPIDFYAPDHKSASHIVLNTKGRSWARKLIFEHSTVQGIVITL